MPIEPFQELRDALADRYQVTKELGRGGMAELYLATDLKHHRQVAIKVLQRERSSMLGTDRFLREIRTAAGLNHPHILPLHDSGEAGGRLYYVMPYVAGGSLRDRLVVEGRLPLEEATRVIRGVAAALDHAHRQGLIHRDIKPENILLHEGEPMVADFGIALPTNAQESERLTGTGFSLGTPLYMSPEQAVGDPELDWRSDLYSMGCVFYELLAGEPPFSGGSVQALVARRLTEPPPSVRRLAPAIPSAVDRPLQKLLATAPEHRFESGAAFIRALKTERTVTSDGSSIAVLPFLNMSPQPESEFFADGITEDVIAQLSRIQALKVISRTSVMQFKKREQSLREIGAALDVGTVLEGSVRQAGNRVRIVAQLIDTATDRHLWAETYDRDLTDIFAIQTDVALQIAGALKARLTPEERNRIRRKPTDNIEAYQSLLVGKHFLAQWTQTSADEALRHFELAVARDPEYALAHATIAYVHLIVAIGVTGSSAPGEAFERSRASVTRALELDDELAEAHAVLAHLKYAADFDWSGAETEFKRAIELNPNSGLAFDAYGLLLSALERYDEAIAAQRRANQLDPLAHRLDIATTFLRAGRYEEGLATVARILHAEPHLAHAHATRGWACMLLGRQKDGLAALERAHELSPDSTMYLGQLGQAYAMAGRVPDARRILDQLLAMSGRQYVSPYHLAYVYTGLGEHERALDHLETAYAERAGAVFGIKGSFLFVALRAHPRFRALLGKMNLV